MQTATDVKRCNKCGDTKPRSDLSVNAGRPDGLQTYCRPCAAMYTRERKYGLTAEEINAMLATGCEVCGTHDTLCIDHDHSTGRVRGVLCDWHNRALGLLHDDLDTIMCLAAYRARF